MNWIKENKFLAGFLVILLIGLGVLGYLFMSAKGKFDEASGEYDKQIGERNRLLSLKPYPGQANLKELQKQKEQAGSLITSLQKELSQRELSTEPVTPEKFQDKLRAAVTEVRNSASSKTKLPNDNQKFYLAFEKYETVPPDKNAAAALARELIAVKWVVDRFIAANITEIRDLKRDPLPEEAGNVRSAREEKPAAGLGKDKGGKASSAAQLVVKNGMNIVVFGDQAAIRQVLNEIVKSKQQFYIPRSIEFKNEKEKGPPRNDPNAPLPTVPDAVPTPTPDPSGATPANPTAPAAGTPPATPAPDAAVPPATPAQPGAETASKYILGEEKVELSLRLEIVDFAPPSQPATK